MLDERKALDETARLEEGEGLLWNWSIKRGRTSKRRYVILDKIPTVYPSYGPRFGGIYIDEAGHFLLCFGPLEIMGGKTVSKHDYATQRAECARMRVVKCIYGMDGSLFFFSGYRIALDDLKPGARTPACNNEKEKRSLSVSLVVDCQPRPMTFVPRL